ncbi:MAG: hypothetical protein IKY70_08030 [Bacteroidales bacterium]|nr:hypothetical protein [Bacteroidales bacterium]
MRNLFYTLVFLVFCISCNNTYLGTDFKNLGTLKDGDTIISNIPCTDVNEMFIVDSLILLNCFNTLDDKSVYVYNKSNGIFITSFGNFGRGPGELDYSDMTYRFTDKSIHFITGHTKQNLKFNLDSVLKNGSIYESIPLGKRLNCLAYPFMDSLLFSTANFYKGSNYRFSIMKNNGDTIVGYRDGTKRDTPVILKPDYTKCFTYTNGALEIEILDLKKDNISLSTIKRYIEPNESLKAKSINQDFPGISPRGNASNKYIYTSWTESISKEFPKKLIIFNWEGGAIGTIEIENTPKFRYVMNVDEEEMKAYLLIETSQGQLNIVRYDMSHLPL